MQGTGNKMTLVNMNKMVRDKSCEWQIACKNLYPRSITEQNGSEMYIWANRGRFYSGNKYASVKTSSWIQRQWISWAHHSARKLEKADLPPPTAAGLMNYSWTQLKEYCVTAFVNWVQLIKFIYINFVSNFSPILWWNNTLPFLCVKCSILQIQ